jgi:hypothetical protein
MLFDLEPKSSREDLFDFEAELNSVINGIKNEKITVIKGLRRTGKTSLMKVSTSLVTHTFTWILGSQKGPRSQTW